MYTRPPTTVGIVNRRTPPGPSRLDLRRAAVDHPADIAGVVCLEDADGLAARQPCEITSQTMPSFVPFAETTGIAPGSLNWKVPWCAGRGGEPSVLDREILQHVVGAEVVEVAVPVCGRAERALADAAQRLHGVRVRRRREICPCGRDRSGTACPLCPRPPVRADAVRAGPAAARGRSIRGRRRQN